MRVLVVAAVVLTLIAGLGLGRAAAEDDDGRMKAYITESAGRLHGRVVDSGGRPLSGAEVTVVARDGKKRIVKTDRDGRYQVTVAVGGSTVFIRGNGHFSEQTMVNTQRKAGGDEVDIQDTLPAAVPPTLLTPAGLIPDYSEEALDDDAWARAWLLLDIDATGKVRRVKLLHRPGHGLDDIAVRAAHGLRFKPARNRADRAIGSVILWTFEWPSSSFLVRFYGTRVKRLTRDVESIRCRGSGPGNTRWQRDCTPADVSGALTLPWLTLKTATR